MECLLCNGKKPVKQKKITHRYKESGLDNIILLGVVETRCPNCGEVTYNFGNIRQLHDVIADLLMRKEGLLSGPELKFLRKHIGYSGKMFAKLLGYSSEHIYKVEGATLPVDEKFDHLVRAMIANKITDRNYDLHDLYLNGTGSTFKTVTLKQTSHGWDIDKVA